MGETTGKKIQSCSQFAPRASITYDIFGNGKTSFHVSGAYYFATKITLANSLSGLYTATYLTWGPNLSSGACSTTPGAPCWTDANRDGLVQVNELVGTPTATTSRFNPATGQVTAAGNSVDPSAQIARTRPATPIAAASRRRASTGTRAWPPTSRPLLRSSSGPQARLPGPVLY